MITTRCSSKIKLQETLITGIGIEKNAKNDEVRIGERRRKTRPLRRRVPLAGTQESRPTDQIYIVVAGEPPSLYMPCKHILSVHITLWMFLVCGHMGGIKMFYK